MKQFKHAVGFTIPEMLAVIAIIVILLALLQPSLHQAKERAREAVCNSNLHQMGIGARGYMTDTRYYPPSYYANAAVWPALIRSYATGETGIFYCPTAEPTAKWEVKYGSGLPAEWGYEKDEVRRRVGGANSQPFSYGHNNGGTQDSSIPPLGAGDPFSPRHYVRSDRVKSASNFIFLADSLVDGVWDHFIDEDVPGEEPAVRHRGGAFVLFGDMHTDYIIPGPYLDPANVGANDPDLRRKWNNDNQPH